MFCVSSYWCCGVDCSLRLWHFLFILTSELLADTKYGNRRRFIYTDKLLLLRVFHSFAESWDYQIYHYQPFFAASNLFLASLCGGVE